MRHEAQTAVALPARPVRIAPHPSPLRRALLLSALACGLAACAGLPTAPPAQQLPLDGTRLGKVVDWLKADVESGRYPGAVVLGRQGARRADGA